MSVSLGDVWSLWGIHVFSRYLSRKKTSLTIVVVGDIRDRKQKEAVFADGSRSSSASVTQYINPA